MSSALPPIAAAPQKLAAGTQASPESGKNNDFTQVLSGVQQSDTNAASTADNLSGLQGEVAGQALPEQGSVLPLEGKLLPQNLLADSETGLENLADLPLDGESPELAPEPSPAYTSDQDLPGLLANELVKPVNPPLASGLQAQPAAGALPAPATNRVTTDPALQAIQTARLQQGTEGAAINLGDTAMQSDGEPGKKDAFFQAMQEMRITSLSQAVSDSSNQTLPVNRETITGLMNTATLPAAVSPEAAKPSAIPTLNLHQPLNRPEWRDEMASRVSWLVKNDQSSAQLRINPAHLGPMEISIKISQDQASVSFVSQHIQVREAVEQAVPRLREMLEQQGLNLTDVDISSGYSQAGQADSGAEDEAGVSESEQALNGSGPTDATDDEDSAQTLAGVLEMDHSNGILDEYV